MISVIRPSDSPILTGTGFGFLDPASTIGDDLSFGRAEIVANDPLTVRYTIADGVSWSDGAPVDAADLLLSWAANSGALNTPGFDDKPYVDASTGEYSKPFPDGTVWFDGTVGSGLEKVTATPLLGSDHRSLTLHFDHPIANWKLALAPGLPAHVVAREALGLDAKADPATADAALVDAVQHRDAAQLGKVADTWNRAYNVTSLPADAALRVSAGPYMVTDVVENQSVTLTANPAYRGQRHPTVEKITLRLVTDPLQTAGLLASGEVDIATPTPTPEVIAALRAVPGVTVTTASEATFEHLDLQFSGSRNGVFDDPRVRQAFLDVVPRQQILDQLITPVQPDAVLLDSFVLRPGGDGYAAAVASNGSRADAQTDVAAASALLASAGVASPEVCILFDPANPRRLSEFQLIQTSAARAGFRVTDCSSADWQGLLGVAGAYDAALFAWDTTRLDATAASRVFRSDAALSNFSHYSDPAVDALVDRIAATADPGEQTTLLTQLDGLIWKSGYGVPLFAYPTVTAVDAKVTGVTRSPLARGVFWDAWNWTPANGAGTPSG